MNAILALLLGVVAIVVGYLVYAKSINKSVIQPDDKKATPAKMYMDGVDFTPANRNVLFGYQFKSIAALGPILGPDRRGPVGLAAGPAVDRPGHLLHRLGAGLYQHHHGRARRRPVASAPSAIALISPARAAS